MDYDYLNNNESQMILKDKYGLNSVKGNPKKTQPGSYSSKESNPKYEGDPENNDRFIVIN